MTGSRRIVYDAEATGGSAEDRLIEIALVEMVGHACTGRTWVSRLDPEGRLAHPGAFRIHGIADADLVGAPRFADKAAEMFDFIGEARIFMHGALDDRRMLDRELARAGLPAIDPERTVDKVRLACMANPGETRHGLDALVARPELLAALARQHDPARLESLVADLPDRRQIFALRWIGRGLAPELAAARERDLDRRERQPSPPDLPVPE